MSKKRSFRITVFCVTLALAVCILIGVPSPAKSASEKVFKWRWQSHMPPGDVHYTSTLTNFVNLVKKMSNGRLDIQLFPGGTLVPSTDILSAVGNRVVEMGGAGASYWKGVMPELLISIMPMGYRNGDDQAQVWYYGLRDHLRPSYAKHGVYLLTIVQSPSIPLLSKKPVRKLEDFKGLKIRTHSATAMLVERLGAKTMMIPGEEIYTALQLGTVDAMTWGSVSTLYTNKWYEQAKNILWDPFLIPNFANDELFVNMNAWNELPDDLKTIVQAAADLAYFENGVTFRHEDRVAKRALEAAGVEFTQFSEKEKAYVQKQATYVWDWMVKQSPKARQSVKILTDYFREMGYTDYKLD
jgi:TRAP-type C4-dicarboxylate transport system substrate-binding protein